LNREKIINLVKKALGKTIRADTQPETISPVEYREQLDQTEIPALELKLSFPPFSKSIIGGDYAKAESSFDKWIRDNDLEQFVTIKPADPWDSITRKIVKFTLDGHLVYAEILIDNPSYSREMSIQHQIENDEEKRKTLAEPYNPEMEFLTIWHEPILRQIQEHFSSNEETPITYYGHKIGLIHPAFYTKVALDKIYFTFTIPCTGKYLNLCFKVPNIGVDIGNVQIPLSKAKELYTSLRWGIQALEKVNEKKVT
jgi:hypothetical protein